MDNRFFYILVSSVKKVKGFKNRIEVRYSNGLEYITKTYEIGDYIETIIDIDANT